METERRRQILLAVVAVVLAVVVYRAWPRTSVPSPSASNVSRPGAPAGTSGTAAPGGRGAAATTARADAGAQAPDVHLEALSDERPKPGETDRNLFRFKPKPPPPPPPQPVPGGTQVPPGQQPVPTGPPPPPPPPPIPLKFIGIVDEAEGRPKIAVLSDNTGGPPLYAREGETVAGRYRILKIGVESIEMAYLDGRGRQTIRLTGS